MRRVYYYRPVAKPPTSAKPPTTTTTTTNPIKKALLIGINYLRTDYELSGCINDVLDMKAELIKNGYLDSNILVLTDNTTYKPIKDNILAGIKWLLSGNTATEFYKTTTFKPLPANSSLFFHYSGHGSQVTDTNKDEKDGRDETICPLDFGKGMITDDTLRVELASKVPNNCKLFAIFDSCHSQSTLDLNWEIITNGNSYTLTNLNSYPDLTANVVSLSGCKDYDTSADVYFNRRANGALTRSVINVLQQAKYNITYADFLVKVRKYLLDNNISYQVPCLTTCKSINISDKLIL